MRKILFIILLTSSIAYQNHAQEKINSDGFNLKDLCDDPKKCSYLQFLDIVYFPYEYDKEWQIENLEVAIKNTGDFLITGDLYIVGQDTAAVLQLDILFFDKDSKTVYTYKADKFEFFNDPYQAEPIVFSGKLPEEIKGIAKFADVGINFSERVPYYTIASNCFHACKSLKLKEKMKVFKKKK